MCFYGSFPFGAWGVHLKQQNKNMSKVVVTTYCIHLMFLAFITYPSS